MRVVTGFFLALLCSALLVFAAGNETVNTLPNNNASFLTQGRSFWQNELPAVLTRLNPNHFVHSGGVHATSGSMVSAAFATEAFTTLNNRVTADSVGGAVSIDYANVGCATTDTAWVIISGLSANSSGNFARSGSSNYFVNCTDATQPMLPSDSAWLMQVTIAAGAITAVSDFRQPASFVRSGVYDITDPLYGAIGDGVTDDTSALRLALIAASLQSKGAGGFVGDGGSRTTLGPGGTGQTVFLPQGTYLITAQQSIGRNVTVRGQGYGSILKKGFAGYLLNMQSFASLEHFAIDGNGGNFLGAGILINSGTTAGIGNPGYDGRQRLYHMAIYDTESYNLEYSGQGVGFGSMVVDSDLRVYHDVVPAIKWPLDSTTPGDRHIINTFNLFGQLLDFGGANNGSVVGSLGSDGDAVGPAIVFSQVECAKGIFVGNRFAAAPTTTIKGSDHVFSGNVFAGPVTLAAESGDVRFDSTNVTVGAVTDQGTNKSNFVDSSIRNWIPDWFGSVTNPTLGNGILIGRYTTVGLRRTVNLTLVVGSTTVLPTGTWTFSLPGIASTSTGGTQFVGNPVTYPGAAFAVDSSTGNKYVGVAYALPGGTSINLLIHGSATVSDVLPFTWASGDTLSLTLSFDL